MKYNESQNLRYAIEQTEGNSKMLGFNVLSLRRSLVH